MKRIDINYIIELQDDEVDEEMERLKWVLPDILGVDDYKINIEIESVKEKICNNHNFI